MSKKSAYPFPHLSERLKSLRTTGALPEFEKPSSRPCKYTREELSEIFCVSTQTISKLENGKNYPSLCLLLKYSLFFKVSIDALCFPSTSEAEAMFITYLDNASEELKRCMEQIAQELSNSKILPP